MLLQFGKTGLNVQKGLRHHPVNLNRILDQNYPSFSIFVDNNKVLVLCFPCHLFVNGPA